MAILFLLFAACVTGSPVAAQVYEATYQADIFTINGKPRSGEVHLRFTGREALFYHPSWPETTEYTAKGMATSFVIGDPEGMPVYTSLPDGTQQYKTDYSAPDTGPFLFTDSIPHVDWQLLPESDTVAGLPVAHASGTYGGPLYDVWYAPDVPVPFGPYRFGGLPGLIVKIGSADGLVGYRLTGLGEAPPDTAPPAPPRRGQPMTDAEFERYIINRLLQVESLSTASVQSTNNSPDPNYDIEVDRWDTIRNYKKDRGY